MPTSTSPSPATAPLMDRLRSLADALRAAAPEAVEMVAVYGSAARGDHRPGVSDVNLLVILRRADPAVLDRLSPVLGPARSSLRLAPFVLTHDELDHACDSFAAKLSDIRLSYECLAGEDVLQDLTIAFADLRLAAERELRNVTLRLRRAYLLGDARPTLRRDALGELLPHLFGTLRVLLARQGQAPAGTVKDLATAAQAAFGTAAEALVQAARARSEALSDDDLKRIYSRLFAVLDQVTRAVDELHE